VKVAVSEALEYSVFFGKMHIRMLSFEDFLRKFISERFRFYFNLVSQFEFLGDGLCV
jgi:hypothetical protein